MSNKQNKAAGATPCSPDHTVDIVNDFKPETLALISRLMEAGFAIVGGHNGEDPCKWEGIDRIDAFLDELLACDECNLYVSRSGRKFTVYLVLGNSPGEIACDWTADNDGPLDSAIMAHSEAWEGRKQPKAWQYYHKPTGKITYKPIN